MDIPQRYENAFGNCLTSLDKITFSNQETPTNPLLLLPPDGYSDSKLKVMYFGQETNDWEGAFGDSDLEDLFAIYDRFANKGGGFRYAGHFWNGVKHFQNRFEELEPTCKFLWNNIVKIGKEGDKGRPSPSLLEWQQDWFSIIRDEVACFQPHVVIFLTGPNYDDLIERVFGPIKLSPIGDYSRRQLSHVKGFGLPEKTYRTYHPHYLWRFGLPDVCETIISEITSRSLVAS